MLNTVPPLSTLGLIKFCSNVSTSPPEAFLVRSKPRKDAIQSACFDNVRARIRYSGGVLVEGWAIWQFADLIFEAEHHAVWQKQNGDYLDVSPQFNNYLNILFLPCAGAKYDPPNFRQNIIYPQNSSADSVEFARLANRRNSILQSYRTVEYINVCISPGHQNELVRI
jgi:hypothetical protein